MQACPHCGAEQLDGTIFCSECGASLLVTTPHQDITATLRQQLHAGIDLPTQPTVSPEPVAQTKEYVINLVILNSGRRLMLDVSEELLIGRKDNARGIFPDVDLALDGGYDAGVSRQHAIIALKDGVCVIEDLESANGTFVNGQRVPPHQPVTIRNGDELKLGTLLLRVELE